MFEFSGVADANGWFQESGPSYDVALASRIRLSRNLSGHRFPGVMKSEEESQVQAEILDAFGRVENAEDYEHVILKDISPTRRRLLLERNYISQEYSLKTDRAVIVRNDQTLSGTINEIDHLRLSSLRGGLQLSECWSALDILDTNLETKIDFAVSLDWGYLNTDVTNAGTGLRGSVMLHLPALVKSGLIDKALKAVVQVGMSVKGFFGDEEGSLGSMYQISNQLSFGFSEEELLEKLDAIAAQLVHYERKAREELQAKRRAELEDAVFRAFGVLTYCRMVSAREAIELLSTVRLGCSLGLIDIPPERLTALLFLTQKAHVQCVVDGNGERADNTMVDFTRAKMIQEALV